MPTLLQINVTSNWGSTGKIAESIGITAKQHGWDSYIAYGRYSNPSQLHTIKVGTPLNKYLHYAANRLFDLEGRVSINATKQLVSRIDKIKPDVVHLHNIHDHWLNYEILFDYLNQSDIKVVWTFHDCWAFTGHCEHFVECNCIKWQNECDGCPMRNKFYDRSRENFILKRKLFTANKNLTIVPVSEWMADLVKKSFFKDTNIQVVHNGVDLNTFVPLKDKSYDEKKRVLAVSNVWPEYKGLKDIVQLRALLPSDYIITVVGLNKKQIESLPTGINGIERTQNIQELVYLYASSDIFINTTYMDTFPTVNIEALACGTPVITYKTGGSPEAIDEKTGIVVTQGDIEDLAEAIKRMKDNSLSREDCRKRTEECFDKGKCFDEYLKLYDNLI